MPNLPYTRDIPHATHNPSSDQPIMETNNNSNDTLWAVDHFGFNDNNGGYHKQVHLKNEAAPGISTVDGVFYANLANAQSWPFWQNALGSFQLMGRNSVATNGYITLPSSSPNPLILQWAAPIVDAAAQPIQDNSIFLFPIAFPTAVFSVVLSAQKASNGAEGLWIKSPGPNTLGFTIRTSASVGQFPALFYFAIGN